MSFDNIILRTDSYKFSHFPLYPEGTEIDYRYISSRGGMFDNTVFFGLQMFIKKYLEGRVVTKEKVEVAANFCKRHGTPFNYEGWMYIVEKCGGRLPLAIKAIPEGTPVPVGCPLAVVWNTDPNCRWLPGHIEAPLLRAVWYGSTVATYSRETLKIIKRYLEETSDGDVAAMLPFKLHDFGARGVSSAESAEIGGAAHLVNSMGSDTVEGVMAADLYYGFPDESMIAGYSIPATEHSITTSEGPEGEQTVFEKVIDVYGKGYGHYACVVDGYDVFNAVGNILGKNLKEKILNADGTFVVRPDSGVPKDMVLAVADMLWESFGGAVNSKGYKVLNPKVRIIQGDGVNIHSIQEILETLKQNGYSTEITAFGMGGKLLQDGISRDLQKFAMKTSAMQVNGVWRDVFKDPITDKGKTSLKGLVTTYRTEDGKYVAGRSDEKHDPSFEEALNIVFYKGNLYAPCSFPEVRKNAAL